MHPDQVLATSSSGIQLSHAEFALLRQVREGDLNGGPGGKWALNTFRECIQGETLSWSKESPTNARHRSFTLSAFNANTSFGLCTRS